MCNFKCPNCKKSDHSGCDVGTVTAMYFQPHYVNGVNVNPDRNTRTSTIVCHNCRRVYSRSTNGEDENIELIRKQKRKPIYNMDGIKTGKFYWE